MSEHAEYNEFARGELVRVRMTPEIVGQVISEKDWGKSYLVRLGGTTEAYWYEDTELETYKPLANAAYGHDEEPPKKNGRVVDLADYRTKAAGGMH